MGLTKKPLRVVPNPYAFIDHNGQPACHVQMAQPEHVPYGTIRYVGAEITHANEVRPARQIVIGQLVHEVASPDHELLWTFTSDPVEVPDIGYYIDHLKQGTLLAGDAFTAKRAGVEFKDPKQVLAAARAKAAAEVDERHGSGTYEEESAKRKAKRLDVKAQKAAEAAAVVAPVAPAQVAQSVSTKEPVTKGSV